jgi:hypothetical protein
MQSTNRFLLTGAGFTHNFGGPLASELWAMIMNHPRIQQTPTLRQLLLQNFDFEDVYNSVMEGLYPVDVKESLERAVNEVYDAIDEIIRDYRFTTESRFSVNIYKLQEFIAAFSGSRKRPGFFFTLNQDLFVERHYYNGPRPQIPGVQRRQDWFSSTFRMPLAPSDYCLVPSQSELREQKNNSLSSNKFYYLKLHGSSNWKSSLRPRQMVIGRAKEIQINIEPLLGWYFEIFETILNNGDARLLVIGYGFADTHVNDVIANAVTRNALRLYILSPESPGTFNQNLQKQHRGVEIWGGLGGYYQSTLAKLFPADQSETAAWRSIKRQFFENKLRWPTT